MGYKEKYEMALERAKKELDTCGSQDCDAARQIFRFFPELKESEDEKVRKTLVELVKCNERCGYFMINNITTSAMLAWLEKQGEQKPTDKVEPKFKVGQWIVWKDKCYKVNYNGCGYELVDQNGLSTSLEYGTIDENAHLWDITKYAKDGDVVSDGTTIFIFKDLLLNGLMISYCDYDTDSGESDAFCPLSVNLMCSKITPATKEQRDLLFSKMKESGYEWDAEKKELKIVDWSKHIKYEPNAPSIVKEKSIWSEEDDKMCQETIDWFEKKCFPYALENDNPARESIKWLKSLKNRVIPQPKSAWSEEDQNALEDVREAIVNYWGGDTQDILLYWLKSIKQRIKKEAV